MDYAKSFTNRVTSFLYAVNKYDHCMEYEFKAALEELDLQDGDVIVNLGGGGLSIDKYISKSIKNVKYIPLEFSQDFADKCNIEYTPHNILPFVDGSVDKIIILALLHHFTDEERTELYKECYRILKDNGKFIVADVIKDSDQDVWLNTYVDRYNIFGHKGLFFTEADTSLLRNENFVVATKIKNYTWWFNDSSEMLDYIRNLFYLNITDNELEKIINECLKPYRDDNKIHFDWQLIYFINSKI